MSSSDDPFATLEPELVWLHFAALTRLPRPSHGEAPAREHVLGWATERGFVTAVDDVGNIVVRVPASPGRHRAPVAVLQAHLDMVCEREPGSPYDPATGDIRVVRDGDWITADGTTLGADDGLGVAAALAAAEDPGLTHGPLELLLTVGEEDGLTGAKGLDASLVSGRLLINLDGTSSDRLTVGCAGSIRTETKLPTPPVPLDDGSETLRLVVSGGQGGHSGEDIHKGRANAISVLGRVLAQGLCEAPFRVVSLDGGKSRNAIPRYAVAVVAAPPGGAERVRAAAVEAFTTIREQFAHGDAEIALAVTPEAAQPTAWDAGTTARALDLVVAIPVGLMAIDPVYGGSETSTSLGLAETEDGVLTLASMTRTSNPQAGEEVVERICSAGRLAGAEIELLRSYPPWRPDPGSELVASASRAFERLHGEPPATGVVHGGLECAVIGSLVPGLDMVSMGADIEGLHAPGERVSITGTQRFYALLGATLDELSG